jgi:RNA polymerase sigma-70 factor (ECF subfamily)
VTTDRELAARVAASGDASAFSELVERHQSAIRCFLRRLVGGDDAAADDLAQETFLAAFTKMHTFRGQAALGTWLHSIAYRKFLSLRRKHRNTLVMAQVPDAGQDMRAATDREILARQLLAQLGDEDRACMTLAYGAGLTHAEIARVVDQPLGSVKARIHRAKLKLQKWLEIHDHSLQTPAEAKSTGSHAANGSRHAG